MDGAWESLSSSILYNSFVYRDRVRNIQRSAKQRGTYLYRENDTIYAVPCPYLTQDLDTTVVTSIQLAKWPDKSGIRGWITCFWHIAYRSNYLS